MIEARSRLIYTSVLLSMTVNFSVIPTVAPSPVPTIVTSTLTSRKRLTPNRLSFQTKPQEALLNARGGTRTGPPIFVIRWLIKQNSRPAQVLLNRIQAWAPTASEYAQLIWELRHMYKLDYGDILNI